MRSLQERAERVLAGGPATLSKHASRFPVGIAPQFLSHSDGAYVWDTDGKRYIDTIAALGPIVLGHNHPAVTEAVWTQAERLSSSSLSTALEVEVAELLVDMIPNAEQVRFASNGKDVTEAAIKLARYVTGKRHVIYCYSPDTEILTQNRGYVFVENLCLGESVATLNPQNNSIEYHPIEKVIAKQFSGDMVHFSSKRLDLLVTPEHQIFFGKEIHAQEKISRPSSIHAGERSFGDFCFAQAETLCSMNTSPKYMLSGGNWNGTHVDFMEIPWNGKLISGSKKVSAKSFMKFIGWFVSEGCLCYSDKKEYVIRLAQKPGFKQDEIIDTIRELGFEPNIYGDKIDFNSEDLWIHLEQFGRGAHNKHIPSPWKKYSSDLLQIMLDAMIDGDGTRRENGEIGKFYSVSKQLIDDVCELALKCGYSTTVSQVLRNGFSLGEIYHVSISKRVLREVHAKNISRVPYVGIVYCLTVKNHLVMTRRNGKAVWSGNCGYHGGFGDYLITTDKAGGILPVLAPYNHQIPWDTIDPFYEALAKYGNDLAGMIVEVPPRPYDELRDETTGVLAHYGEKIRAHGGLFILDEVVTGFRYGLGGAQAFYGVTADLATFSKGMANGYKLAALTGPRALMQAFDGGKLFLSTTFGGECTSLAACKATLETLRDTDALGRLQWHGPVVGASLEMSLREAGLPVTLRGNFARYVLDWHDVPGLATAAEWRTLWLQELCKRGVLASVPIFPMCCYESRVVNELGQAILETCRVMKQVVDEQVKMVDLLECPVIGDVFGQRYTVQEPA